MKRSSDESYELKPPEIRQLIRLARFRRKEIFYDLGCASGNVVRQVARNRKIRRAVGIDDEPGEIRKAWTKTLRDLSDNRLWYIDFRLAKMQDYDYSDASVIYQGVEENRSMVDEYRKTLGRRRVRIITKDLPLVGFLPFRSNPRSNRQRFFVTRYPLRRTKNLGKWIEAILDRPATLKDVYSYYREEISSHYPDDEPYAKKSVAALERLIKKRFELGKARKKR